VPHRIDHAGEWALARLSDPSGRVFPALVARDRVLDLSAVAGPGSPSTTAELLDRWDDVLPVLGRLAATAEGWRPLVAEESFNDVDRGLLVAPPV
jgi:2,4-didehydro-3-deoxy-L-rhamnonate hydrolase